MEPFALGLDDGVPPLGTGLELDTAATVIPNGVDLCNPAGVPGRDGRAFASGDCVKALGRRAFRR